MVDFHAAMQEQLDVYPIWLLPMRNIPDTKAIFAAPNQTPTHGQGSSLNQGEHLCNVGAYGIPRKKYDFERANRELEGVLHAHGGRKVYYSHSFYDRDFFYEDLYDGQEYFSLRDRFVADGALPEIYDKIITKNMNL